MTGLDQPARVGNCFRRGQVLQYEVLVEVSVELPRIALRSCRSNDEQVSVGGVDEEVADRPHELFPGMDGRDLVEAVQHENPGPVGKPGLEPGRADVDSSSLADLVGDPAQQGNLAAAAD